MPALKPELRYDRNGMLVTRWVKIDDRAKQASIPAPSPILPAAPRASSETKQSLEEFFENFAITREYPYAQVLRRNVALMSEGNALELVHGLWEDYNAFGNPEAVAGTLERIYGDDSPVPQTHRDTVFKNFIDIIPPYDMNWDGENEAIIDHTWVIFDAIDGEQEYELLSEEAKLVYQSAACVTNHIFRVPEEAPDDLEVTGFTRVGKNEDELALDGTGAIDALRDNLNIIEQLRDSLRHRNSLHVDVIREMASAGVLSEGTL